MQLWRTDLWWYFTTISRLQSPNFLYFFFFKKDETKFSSACDEIKPHEIRYRLRSLMLQLLLFPSSFAITNCTRDYVTSSVQPTLADPKPEVPPGPPCFAYWVLSKLKIVNIPRINMATHDDVKAWRSSVQIRSRQTYHSHDITRCAC